MGGMTANERLRESGIDAKKGNAFTVPVTSLWFPPKDDEHYGILAHPRENDELDEAMIQDMLLRFEQKKPPIEHDALVWDVGPGPDKRRRLLVINGCRRTKHGIEAENRLREMGKIKAGESIHIGIVFWTPPKGLSEVETKAAALAERLRQNRDDYKKADSIRVLADTAQSLRLLGRDEKSIAEVMPKGISAKDVAALLEYDNVHPDARAIFEAGAPIGLLSVVLEAPREGHAEKLAQLQSSGVTSSRGVTRQKNAAEKRAEGLPAQRMNAKTLLKATLHFADLADEEEKKPEDERDPIFSWINCALSAAYGSTESRDKLRELLRMLRGDDTVKAFDRAIGLDKSTGRPRGRPKKNEGPRIVPGISSNTGVRDIDDEDADESGDED